MIWVDQPSLSLKLFVETTNALGCLVRCQLVIECARPLSFQSCNCILARNSDTSISQVRSDNDAGAAHSSMAVHQYSIALFFLYMVVDLLANSEYLLVACDFQILPIEVVVGDARIAHKLRVITEPNRITHQAISTKRMLTWLL